MIIGLNTDTKIGGKIYHIQTEDGGRQNPVITTHVFSQGAILFSKRTNYADIIRAEYFEDIIKDLMKQQHSATIKDLASGKLLTPEGRAAAASGEAPSRPATPASAAPGKRDKTRKDLDALIVDYLEEKERKGDA